MQTQVIAGPWGEVQIAGSCIIVGATVIHRLGRVPNSICNLTRPVHPTGDSVDSRVAACGSVLVKGTPMQVCLVVVLR